MASEGKATLPSQPKSGLRKTLVSKGIQKIESTPSAPAVPPHFG